MLCPKCLKSVDQVARGPSGLLLCPHCGIQFMTAVSDPGATVEPPAAAAPAVTPIAPPPAPARSSASPIRYVVIAIVIFLAMRATQSDRIPALSLTPAAGSTGGDCLSKPSCVIVYVAPWCPACHSSHATILALAAEWKRSRDIGITVVVGMDSTEKLQATADEFPDGAFLDPDGRVRKALKVQGVPYWVVVESPSKVVKRMAGGFGNVASVHHFLGVGG